MQTQQVVDLLLGIRALTIILWEDEKRIIGHDLKYFKPKTRPAEEWNVGRGEWVMAMVVHVVIYQRVVVVVVVVVRVYLVFIAGGNTLEGEEDPILGQELDWLI